MTAYFFFEICITLKFSLAKKDAVFVLAGWAAAAIQLVLLLCGRGATVCHIRAHI